MLTPRSAATNHPAQVVVCHGAGSSPDVARTLMPETLDKSRSWAYLANIDGSTDTYSRHLDDEWKGGNQDRPWTADAIHPSIFAGISLGAHAVALWASRAQSQQPLVLALPAWTGPPNHVAAMTTQTADQLQEKGIAAYLDDLSGATTANHVWILDALQRSWGTADAQRLIRQLRTAGQSMAPTHGDLARVVQPTLVIGLTDDPMHPLDVARAWAQSLPRSELVAIKMADVQRCGSLATPSMKAAWQRLLERL